MKDTPYTVQRGYTKTAKYLLTHIEWHPANLADIDIGQNETGIRRVEGGTVNQDSFQLIQHGWRDFGAAERFILRALDKGWDAYRITRLMSWAEDNQRFWCRGVKVVFLV